MPEDNEETKEPLVLLQSFPLDEHAAEEEKIDSLWRQMMVYKAFAEQDLSESRSRRVEAEAVRERTEQEAFATTQALCEKMKAEAESELHEARQEHLEAIENRQNAEAALKQARDTSEQAERDRDKMIANAEKQAQETIDQARAVAQQETTELRRQALKEIKNVLSRVETMKAAANEELETQRILSNVAKLKATTRWMMGDGETQNEDQGASSEAATPVPAVAYASAPVPAAAPAAAPAPKSSKAQQTASPKNIKEKKSGSE